MSELEREELDVNRWKNRSLMYNTANYAITSVWMLYSNMNDVILAMEKSLNSSPLGGIGYQDRREYLGQLVDDYNKLDDYITQIPNEINDAIDDPLFKEYNHIVDDLATIDVNSITTANTLGLQAEHTLVDEYGMPVSTYMQDMSSLTLADFTGGRVGERAGNVQYCQSVESFSSLLEDSYHQMVENGSIDGDKLSLEDYLDSLTPSEFAHKKEVETWKEVLEDVSQVLIIPGIIEACTGKELITGDNLTADEQQSKALSALAAAGSVSITVLCAPAGLSMLGYLAVAGTAIASDAAATATYSIAEQLGVDPAVCFVLSLIAGGVTGSALDRAIAKNPALLKSTVDDTFSQLNTQVDTMQLPEETWNKPPLERGNIIDDIAQSENGVGHNFPTIDTFDEKGIVTSVKSRDLTSPTYQNANTLERTMRKDIDKLDQFSGRNWGGINIKPSQIKGKQLQLVVPNASLSDAQIEAINRVIQYADSKGINMIITVGR